MNCNGILYQGKHPTLIRREVFDKAQLAFKKVNISKVRKNFDFLFPGIAKCGVCGYAFCAERQKGKHVYTIDVHTMIEVVRIQTILAKKILHNL